MTSKEFLALFGHEFWNYLALVIDAPNSEEHGQLVFVKNTDPTSNFSYIAPLANKIDPALRFKKIVFNSRRDSGGQPFSLCGITMEDALYCVSAERIAP